MVTAQTIDWRWFYLELYGCHFEYAGTTSRRYGLIFANANTQRLTALAGNISANTIYSKRENKNYFIQDDYVDSPVSFEAEIITDNDRGIPLHDRREVEKWLFNRPEYCRLYIDISDDTFKESYEFVGGIPKRLYLNCRFVNPEKMEYNGGIVGYRCTVECDSCMAWQDAVTESFDLGHASASDSSVITVEVDSDLNDFLYPEVTITVGDQGGDIIIANNTDDETRLTGFTDLSPGITLILKGSINYVSGENYEKFSNRHFIRLCDGENRFTVMGNVSSISFTWQNRRYL